MIIKFILEAFLLAIVFDLVFAEPRPLFHPTVWIGTLIGFLDRHAAGQFKRLYGVLMALFCIGMAAIAGYFIPYLLYQVSPLLALLVTAYLLKSTFSLSFLWQISGDIYGDLKAGKLDAARAKLPALVGRDVSKLDEGQMASCVIESLGESFVDGIFSPLFYFVIFGLPGAMAYRAINTLDSMVGYKDEKHIKVGWASARIDDVANFIPARLAVLIMALISGHLIRSLKTSMRDGRNAPSINSGYPMAAFAGALGLRLEKLGYYVLGEGLKPCGADDIPKAIWLNRLLTATLVIVIIAALWLTPLPLL
ncbi:probable cobalamin biosynthesis protein CobD [Methanocella paludicola SANAE]|uniref:Probable cobalamin biosynthesis protein CobD n=1 Tax=Methanocella paludicola (strain DSM 17711 / JCM 13418 / NBRC 101707 / SANAE) TaxID=304371 RepID=D1Z003_METPS|nr:cobalamin biosynthesis protein [Methanocella paludicola]BAI62025.1 probable cobalamin biosynthesis protein CobD [Methanocella paludicola SANAE]